MLFLVLLGVLALHVLEEDWVGGHRRIAPPMGDFLWNVRVRGLEDYHAGGRGGGVGHPGRLDGGWVVGGL